MPKFKVNMLKEAREFLLKQPLAVQKKISYNIDIVSSGTMDSELFKKLDGTDIWEFRTLYNGNSYRLLAFWDTRTEALVVATHGFSKKTQKTPPNEIAHAENIREQYFNND